MNKNLSELATIKIECNEEIGTAMIFFPDSRLEYVYIFTAKHCLAGENFDQKFTYKDIKIEKIFNPETKSFHNYELSETDIIAVSGDDDDLALIILPKQRILDLTGMEFESQVIAINAEIIKYLVRGFANFNGLEDDRSFPLRFIEDKKNNKKLFLLKSDENLDTYFEGAINNVKGLSSSGVYAQSKGIFYLVGIMHKYEEGNIFTATKVLAYNELIDSTKFLLLHIVKPEIN